MMGIAKRRRKKIHEPFVMIGRGMLLRCKEWKELSAAAKIFYVYLKAKFNGANNGEIRLYYSELKEVKGLSSPSTVSKAIKELEVKGWIRREKRGGLFRYNNDYSLTGKFDNCIC